jgi:hypothetical protein
MTWQHSVETAATVAAIGIAMGLSKKPRVRAAGAFAREIAMIGFLYGLWGLAGEISGLSTNGAFARARWIERFEHDIFLPYEASVQHLILGHSLVVQTANLYYATMHFTMMFVFLFWLFVWHRERYKPVRSVMALTTLFCLIVQFLPIAPPRMLPGIIDTAKLYHQSVYEHGYALDQLSAMPSVHVAWAVLVGFYTWRIGISRWRYLGPAHAAITVFVVVATGNHWWLDGIVAVILLIMTAWLVAGLRTAWHSVRAHLDAQSIASPSSSTERSRASVVEH